MWDERYASRNLNETETIGQTMMYIQNSIALVDEGDWEVVWRDRQNGLEYDASDDIRTLLILLEKTTEPRNGQ